MILSRLSRAFREQNWFAVAIEFVVVVAGVVIGFTINAWNSDRAERIIITEQLAEVREDVRTNIAALEITREAGLWRIAAAEFILERVEDGAVLPGMMLVFDTPADMPPLPVITPEDHPTLLARVNLVRGVTGQRTGYDSIVSAGNLRLIGNDELRIAIQRYYAGYEDLQNNLAIFREIRAPALPILYRHGFSLFAEADLTAVIEAARSDPEFAAYLATGREMGVAQTSSTLQREAQARDLLALIDAELAE